jgi:hypothetical protein
MMDALHFYGLTTLLVLAVILGCVLGTAVNTRDMRNDVQKIRRGLECTHGESSTAVAVVGGRVRQLQPPTVTGCVP